MTLSEAGDIAAGLGHLRQDRPRQDQQSLADGGEAQRADVFFDQRSPIVSFQGLELMRQGGLGQKQARRSLGKAAALGQGLQSLQMSDFQGSG
jgi:hypothetical protein